MPPPPMFSGVHRAVAIVSRWRLIEDRLQRLFFAFWTSSNEVSRKGFKLMAAFAAAVITQGHFQLQHKCEHCES